jgi:cell division protein FtsI/penicillin-binding protein 2
MEGDIIVSIDPQVQLFLENKISKIQKKWNSNITGGIIMDAKNGKIYAMSVVPDFDNNDFSHEPLSVFKNPLVSSVYEFGSVMKPLVVSIALDNKIVNANTEFYDKGFIKVEKHTIYNFDKKARGWVTVQDILNQSLNTGMVFIAGKIKKDIFRDYFSRYGFGEKSGVDLPNDASGLVSNLKSNRNIEFANMSFGQGIAISPISFIKALSALANDGKTVTPHLVTKIKYTNGFSKTIEPKGGNYVLKPETSHEISRMLVNVFDSYRNGKAKLPHHSIAVKTGTAQMANPKGGYYKNKHLHSFFGYFPAYDPKLIVFLYTVDPKGIKYASQTLLDPFRSTAEYLINHYNVPPDR